MRKIFIYLFPLLMIISCNNKNGSLSNSSNSTNTFSISEQTLQLRDLKYLIGVKINSYAKENDYLETFNEKEKGIKANFINNINQILSNSGFNEKDFYLPEINGQNSYADSTSADGPLDDYHQRKEDISNKIEAARNQKNEELKNIAADLLNEKIKKDDILKKLINEYNKILADRTALMSEMNIAVSDSTKFFNKDYPSYVDEELLLQIIQKK
jgi:hypothetical protein